MIACIKSLSQVQLPGNTGSASRKCLWIHLQTWTCRVSLESSRFLPIHWMNVVWLSAARTMCLSFYRGYWLRNPEPSCKAWPARQSAPPDRVFPTPLTLCCPHQDIGKCHGIEEGVHGAFHQFYERFLHRVVLRTAEQRVLQYVEYSGIIRWQCAEGDGKCLVFILAVQPNQFCPLFTCSISQSLPRISESSWTARMAKPCITSWIFMNYLIIDKQFWYCANSL